MRRVWAFSCLVKWKDPLPNSKRLNNNNSKGFHSTSDHPYSDQHWHTKLSSSNNCPFTTHTTAKCCPHLQKNKIITRPLQSPVEGLSKRIPSEGDTSPRTQQMIMLLLYQKTCDNLLSFDHKLRPSPGQRCLCVAWDPASILIHPTADSMDFWTRTATTRSRHRQSWEHPLLHRLLRPHLQFHRIGFRSSFATALCLSHRRLQVRRGWQVFNSCPLRGNS